MTRISFYRKLAERLFGDLPCKTCGHYNLECPKDCEYGRPSAEATKKKAKLKENGDWDCPDVGCDECEHNRSVEWCSLAIPNHEEIDDTYKMVNEAFFEGFNVAEKHYRLLIETIEEIDKKSAEAEWIPCSERLPNEDEKEDEFKWYLVTVKGHGLFVDVAPFEDKLWKGLLRHQKVLAWMPLPKPYKNITESEVEE